MNYSTIIDVLLFTDDSPHSTAFRQGMHATLVQLYEHLSTPDPYKLGSAKSAAFAAGKLRGWREFESQFKTAGRNYALALSNLSALGAADRRAH
jgi:hypothetical protein